MPRVILVHGWASAWSGRYDVDKLAPYFKAKGHEVVQFDYGFHLLVSHRIDEWTERLWGATRSGGVICGHSNAAVLVQRLSWIPTFFPQTAILLNPALSRNAKFGPFLRKLYVFHTPYDIPIRIAGLLPWHSWGWGGADGIKAADENCDMSTDHPVKVWTHLGLFREPALSFYGPLIAGLV